MKRLPVSHAPRDVNQRDELIAYLAVGLASGLIGFVLGIAFMVSK